MALSATLNTTVELVGYRRLRNAPRLAPLITAVGMSFILQNVASISGAPTTTRPTLISNSAAFSIGDVQFQWDNLVVIF